MDGQQASRLLDLVSSMPGGLWTMLGLLFAFLVALVSFSAAMWRYGGDIKKLNEGDTLGAFLRLNTMLNDASSLS